MTKTHTLSIFTLAALLGSSTFSQAEKPAELDAFSPEVNAENILKVSNAAADWQLANPHRYKDWEWTEAALWTGMMAHAQTTGDAKYFEALHKVAKDLDYKLGPRPGHADDHCVGQLYLWQYLRDEIPAQIQPTIEGLDNYIDQPHDEGLKWVNHIHMREWSWCDALYMSPPTLAMLHAATGDEKYLESMDKLYWKTTDYLFDKEDDLFWRDSRYIGKKEKNGENVYWSRGNGWVFAGLCHILQHMPENHEYRPKYVALFKKMAAKLKSIQLEDGSWHASLLDPDSFPSPETSGTAFFAYGFLWGINNGILPEAEYKDASFRAWDRLVKNVHADGKVGYIQPVGEDPRQVTIDQTEVYGVGGFLQCAHELHKYLVLEDSKIAKLTVTNPSDFVRLNEVISLDWKVAKQKLPSITPENAAVRDGVRGYFVPTQVVDENQDGTPEALLFQVDLTPNENRTVQLCAVGKVKPNFQPNQLTARFVPERKDDFAWENDRIAFRAYGPALASEGSRGGIDVWTKSVRTPVVNEWYEKGEEHYHTDNGTGLDGYKVGPGLGCGGLGYLDAEGQLVVSPVFAKYKVLETGPLRLKFQLSYEPVEVGNAKVQETRTITMLAGQHAFKVESAFKVEGDAKGIKPVAGLSTRDKKTRPSEYSGLYTIYWDPVMAKEHGHIGTFVINNEDALDNYKSQQSHLLKVLAGDLSKPVSYYAGAAWEKVDVPGPRTLGRKLAYLYHEINHPVTVK